MGHSRKNNRILDDKDHPAAIQENPSDWSSHAHSILWKCFQLQSRNLPNWMHSKLRNWIYNLPEQWTFVYFCSCRNTSSSYLMVRVLKSPSSGESSHQHGLLKKKHPCGLSQVFISICVCYTAHYDYVNNLKIWNPTAHNLKLRVRPDSGNNPFELLSCLKSWFLGATALDNFSNPQLVSWSPHINFSSTVYNLEGFKCPSAGTHRLKGIHWD